MEIITRRKNFSYPQRKHVGDCLETRVASFFHDLGFNAVPSGQGYIPKNVSRDLIQLSDCTSKFVRFFPDLIIPIPSRNLTILADCKNTKGHTSNYSFCLDSFRFHQELAASFDLLILYIFPPQHPGDGLRGTFVQDLKNLITNEISDSARLKHINGSTRPFALVQKLRVPRLSLVMDRIFNAEAAVA